MAQRTSANLIRALYNLSREHDSHKRKSLLNAGLIEMIKWFSLAARKIVQGKMKFPKQTQLINNYSTPTRIFTFNYYLISNVSPYWLHQE